MFIRGGLRGTKKHPILFSKVLHHCHLGGPGKKVFHVYPPPFFLNKATIAVNRLRHHFSRGRCGRNCRLAVKAGGFCGNFTREVLPEMRPCKGLPGFQATRDTKTGLNQNDHRYLKKTASYGVHKSKKQQEKEYKNKQHVQRT